MVQIWVNFFFSTDDETKWDRELVSTKSLQPSLIWVGKTRILPETEAPEG